MIVIDASVAVKWTVEEVLHAEALDLAMGEQVLAAPDLVLLETQNVLRRKFKRGEVSAAQLSRAVEELPGIFDLLPPVASLFSQAAAISALLDHPIYDCAYLACAVRYQAILVTADDHFERKVAASGFSQHILALGATTSDRLSQRRQSEGVEFRALELWRVFDRTMSHVQSNVARPFGLSSARIIRTDDLQPAFESPSYLRLHRFVSALTISQKARLLALSWFGRSHMAENWDAVLEDATRHIAGENPNTVGYIISTFHTLEAGIEKFRLISETQS